MMRKILAAGLMVLGTSQYTSPAHAGEHGAASCGRLCVLASTETAPGSDALATGVAHIAVRAATPDSETAPLTRQDLMSLYLLLSLQSSDARS